MSIWQCPHCRSVAIIVRGETYQICLKNGCGAVLERVENRDARLVIAEALQAHEPSLTEQLEDAKAVNAGLKRIVEALNSDDTGGAS